MTTLGSTVESAYANSVVIETLLEDSKLALGAIDLKEPLRIFKRNWIENVGDLRLLQKEDELLSLVQIPDSLLKWLSDECSKVFQVEEILDVRDFRYSFDFDTNGIVHYLGTLAKNGLWSNPMTNGYIKVLMSSVMHDSTPPATMLGKDLVRCVTKPERNSFIVIDFNPRSIRPTHYSLRHYSSWDTEALRTWKFEGGQSKANQWDVLNHHRNDASLNKKGATNTWKLSNVSSYYSRFRIFQTDFNSNRHYYLACSGFEIYGSMKDVAIASMPMQAANNSSKTLTFLHSYDMDTNGILYWLGTQRGTQPWKNPALSNLCRIFQSSLSKDSHASYAVVGRETVRCVTEPKEKSWFVIDLKEVQVIPTHYTIRHYLTFDTECVRNWRYEASNDSTNGADGHWKILLTHRNDTSLNRKGGTHTWNLPSSEVNNQSYSQFRLYQFGVNSNQHHYLAVSGFELYGTVVAGQHAIKVDANVPAGVSRTFAPSAEFDTNGLLYFLGFAGGNKSWINPAEQHLVAISSSSLMSDSHPLSTLAGRSAVRCVTKPHQRSWMAINLKSVKIRLSHYSLRHYNSWDTEALRYWNVEGSVDGKEWIRIRQHVDDRALRKAGMSHTWAVDCNQFFSHFRIFMTGRNSNNHWYLACSGLELYGMASGGLVSVHPNLEIVADSHPSLSAVPPPPSSRVIQQTSTFNYVSNFDTNGLIYFLGTLCNTVSEWRNPATIGLITIRDSGLMRDSAPAAAFIGRQLVRAVTRPMKQAWIIIDLLDYAICPTHYTLRHYSSWDTEALRNWRFEGSCDGERWTVIREHRNDVSLNRKGQAYTWPLNCAHHFSMFRLFQFDKNSNSHYYLSCSGFEIYGSVVRGHTHLFWDSWPKNKSKHLQVDTMRNTVQNAGSEDTWQTCKTRQPINFKLGPLQEFSVLVERVETTTNSWKFMAGIAPDSFSCTGSRQWLGSQQSWAYIGGTGGKCFNTGKSIKYGELWGTAAGDLITCIANLQTRNLEFIKNLKSQGIAFNNFSIAPNGSVFAAVSITATGGRVRMVNRVHPRSGLPANMQKRFQQPLQMNAMKMPMMVGQNIPPPAFAMQNIARAGTPAFGWDPVMKSPHLAIFTDGVSVTNKGSNDTWQGIASKIVWSSGIHSFEIHTINDAKTSNTWKFIVGVAPAPFDPKRTAWLGSQGSWGYIGGTGGKCHSVGKSVAYGKRFGGVDKVRCTVDFNKGTIEFFKNGKSQGIAFSNLKGAVKPAISLTGKDATLRICNAQ